MRRRAADEFVTASAAERNNADLFLIDLLGVARVRPVRASLSESQITSLTEDVPVSLTMRSGGIVGNSSSATNVREDVLNALDRLHLLWSITNDNYGREYPRIAALAGGSRVANPDVMLPQTLAAIRQNQGAHLHHDVMRNFFGIDVSAAVGEGQPNRAADVRMLQTILVALELLAETKLNEGTPSAGTIPSRDMPATLNAIRAVKAHIAGGRLGWDPIHADELEAGGDRFGGRTYQWKDLGVFVPRGAGVDRSNVHVFFSPGDATGESGLNAVLHHGLRAASEGTGWILIGVPTGSTIDTAQIEGALRRVGRSATIERLRLSAHSRGANGLSRTINGRLIDIAKVDRVVILDAGWKSVANMLTAARIPKSKVMAYQVTDALLPSTVARTVQIPAKCARAIGYSRLIQDAMRTRPALVIPADVHSQLLTLPVRGQFTALTSTRASSDDLVRFCHAPANASRIAAIVRDEAKATGLKTFFDTNDLGRLGLVFVPETYSHHFFVAEIAHEITR